MDRFIYIRNAEDDAYMNTADNFRGMEQAASAVVDLYFESPITSAVGPSAYDKITLAVTADKEKEAMLAIGGALAGGKPGSTVIVADDHGSAYCADEILSVTTILVEFGRKSRSVTLPIDNPLIITFAPTNKPSTSSYTA